MMTDSFWRPDIIHADPTAHRSRVPARKPSQTEPADGQQDQVQLQRACNEFESVFIAFLLKEMRATVDKSGLIDGGKSEQLYESMMDAELSRELASAGGFGLAKMLYDQLRGRSDNGTAGSTEHRADPVAAAAPKSSRVR